MTDEQRKAKIAALLEERRGYVSRGLLNRAAQVDEQLRLLGAEGAPPVKRAERRKAAPEAATRKRPLG